MLPHDKGYPTYFAISTSEFVEVRMVDNSPKSSAAAAKALKAKFWFHPVNHNPVDLTCDWIIYGWAVPRAMTMPVRTLRAAPMQAVEMWCAMHWGTEVE